MEKMCEQTELNYLDGDVVWVKLGSCWWPGEVVGSEKLPADVLPSFRKPPIAVVKFFQEDSYEYVKNHNAIYKYECSRKNEFIQKGLYLYRTKHGLMEKFPEDVIRAETAVGGDIEILTRDEFQETKKESYADLFGDPRKKTPGSSKKGKSIKGRSPDISKTSTLIRKIKEKSNYQVHILVQSSKASSQPEDTTPSTSTTASEPPEEILQESKIEPSKPVLSCSTPTVSSSGIYACHACPFTTSRLNVLILHNKTHSATFSPYIPSPSKKKTFKTTKSPKPLTTTQKPRKPRQEKLDEKQSKKQKRVAEDKNDTLHEVKKAKTDEEIKSSLLADWEDGDEDSNEESTAIANAGSPDIPVAAGCPAVPTPAELSSALVSSEASGPIYEIKKKLNLPSEKPETSNDAKYDFCEDEDWPVEADVGRKIPRVKPLIRKDEIKSLSIDENDMAREVAELLNKTTVPEMPSAPEPLKVEENFPEGSIVKSPDKQTEKSSEESASPEKKADSDVQPPKTIFKTKTFFRSRHSRSQDAIGKYVAEQLNAAERLDSIDNDANGSEIIPSPEPRISSPTEHIKVARLAPKIQLKKMKAEAAQLRQKEKCDSDNMPNELINPPKIETLLKDSFDLEETERENNETFNPEHTPEQSSDIKTSDISGYATKASIIVNEKNVSEITSDTIIKEVPNLENSTTNEESTNQSDKVQKEGNTHKSYEPHMNDSTASAVDALLSVSREADRVTKVISDDPPEDLFEDDIKDSASISDINGCDKSFNEDRGSNMEGVDSPIQPAVPESVNPIIEVLPSKIESQPIQVISEIIIPTKIENFKNEDSLKNEITIPELSESGQSKTEEFKEDIKFCSDDLNSQKNEESETQKENVLNNLPNSTPSESDLQIAEALINLPSTTIQNKVSIECRDQLITLSPVVNDPIPTNEIIISTDSFQKSSIKSPITVENLHEEKHVLSNSPTLTNNIRFESEEEKCENLNAAQSLVQMSESIDHKITATEIKTTSKSAVASRVYGSKKDVKGANKNDIKLNEKPTETTIDKLNGTTVQVEKTSKLLKILEEPCTSRVSITNNAVVNKKVILPGKEKTLNLEINHSSNKPKQSTNQKIIIRRTTTPHKTLLNNITEVTTPDKIILSRTNKPSEDGSSVQSYTIQTTPDVQTDKNTIIIQPKIRKIAKPAPKFQKIKPQTTTVSINNKISKELKPSDTVFDINSMPIVLSDDILTPESIEKMPIVMSDGNIITSSSTKIKNKKVIANNEKITVTSSSNKQDVRALSSHHAGLDGNKVTTPNILSKSPKVRSPKHMLVIDKTTGKQKFIMTKPDPPTKEVKQQPKLIQTIPQSKTEKFVILPPQTSPRPARTQKIVIDPQTGKAHVVVGKGPVASPILDNKPVSAKLIPSASDTKAPGNTVMIITNAQGTQSRIVLTPEHEKILFPNKQQPNVSQLKTIAHRISTNTTPQQKSLVTTVAPVKNPSRIISKQQKSAIITSKGQLLVGGRITATTQNIAPLPEIRPAAKRTATEPKKLAPAIQKTEPLIFLQKSGAVMQLTAAQFEHLQRTGQIIQKVSIPQQENKVVVQKPITMSSTETLVPVQKQRARKQQTESPTLIKKFKHEIAIAPAPAPTPMPALTPIVSATTNITANLNFSNPIAASSTYSNAENFEELFPTTAISRSNETVVAQPEQITQTPTVPLSDGQLLAVPGEHFGGPQGSFYLCVEENGTFTPIDNRPLVLENNQLVPMPESIPVPTPQPERRDILEAALANSDVFHAEGSRDEAPDFRDLNANVSVHCRVSETSTTLNQPIMTPVEVPTKADSELAVPSNLDDGLAVIGVTPHTVPTSLELPITVTDPRIAPKTTDPLSNNNYKPSLLSSPNTEMTFVVTEDTNVPVVGPISMPLLTEEESVGKSMPILIDEITERTVSSVESTVGSPSSIDVRESETEDGNQWQRRLLTPGSDISEASVEIPLQPAIQLSVSDLSHNNS